MPAFDPRYIGGRDGRRLRTATFDAAPGIPQRGVCALFSGQTEFIEKYGEVIAELSGRGYRVAVLDWRGQGGSLRALADPLKVHIGDFREYDEDLTAFMDMVVRPFGGGPVIALAHSMGGHILLRALKAQPRLFAGAVLSAPMIAMQLGGYPHPVARALCWAQNRMGNSEGWVQPPPSPLNIAFRDNRVTSDEARFLQTQALLAENPALRTVGPTWGWLEAAFQSTAEFRSRGYAEGITTPVLVCGAGRDRIVFNSATAAFARRLPQGKFLDFEDAEHEILMERDPIRARFWEAFDRFTDRLA